MNAADATAFAMNFARPHVRLPYSDRHGTVSGAFCAYRFLALVLDAVFRLIFQRRVS